MKTALAAFVWALFTAALLHPSAGLTQISGRDVVQESVQDDYAELAKRHGLQQTFPGGAAPPPERQGPRRVVPTGGINISSLLLSALAIAVAGVFIYFIVTNARAYRRHSDRFKARQNAPVPVEVWGTVPEDSWDALLNRLRLSGDLNEALHEMLLAAIGFCQKELSIHIPRANTPREIQDALPTDFAALEAFETLVQGAELAWFGAKPVDRPMFQSGLDALERILRLK